MAQKKKQKQADFTINDSGVLVANTNRAKNFQTQKENKSKNSKQKEADFIIDDNGFITAYTDKAKNTAWWHDVTQEEEKRTKEIYEKSNALVDELSAKQWKEREQVLQSHHKVLLSILKMAIYNQQKKTTTQTKNMPKITLKERENFKKIRKHIKNLKKKKTKMFCINTIITLQE